MRLDWGLGAFRTTAGTVIEALATIAGHARLARTGQAFRL